MLDVTQRNLISWDLGKGEHIHPPSNHRMEFVESLLLRVRCVVDRTYAEIFWTPAISEDIICNSYSHRYLQNVPRCSDCVFMTIPCIPRVFKVHVASAVLGISEAKEDDSWYFVSTSGNKNDI